MLRPWWATGARWLPPRYSTVAGIPLTELLPADGVETISRRTADGGAGITRLVATSAWDAPGSGAADMVEVILEDEKRFFPAPNFS
jgi:malate dehydrogenase